MLQSPHCTAENHPLCWTYCFSNSTNLCQILSSIFFQHTKSLLGVLACEERGQALWKQLLDSAKCIQRTFCLDRKGAGAWCQQEDRCLRVFPCPSWSCRNVHGAHYAANSKELAALPTLIRLIAII